MKPKICGRLQKRKQPKDLMRFKREFQPNKHNKQKNKV